MCGIFFLQRSSYHIAKSASKILKHRGPDTESIIVDENKTVIFQRLAINDSVNGGQPMIDSKNKITFMCNGEIFNHKEIEKTLNIECTTKSDCEVLFQMYRHIAAEDDKNSADKACFYSGAYSLDQVNGDFAMCIVDEAKNKVVVARDRIGVRPLFYGFTNSNELCIASEAKSMWMCDSVNHVTPGSVMVFYPSGFIINYYEPGFYAAPKHAVESSYDSLKKDLYVRMENAVKLRLMTDRPIGCLLSGGLDSSIVCSLLCRLVGAENVRTYSIGMEGSLDLKYAKLVSEHLKTKHTEVLFTPEQGLAAIPEVIYALESYDITSIRASVPMFLLGRFISKNTDDKVIFSGEGSDELFCGYLYFHDAPSALTAHFESMRLISELYLYDCLRADRCISTHGLELRVPFLDKEIIDFCTHLPGEYKNPDSGVEKRILREIFSDMLPSEVAWRRKDGFSDGVSSTEKSWYQYIQEYVEKVIELKDVDINDCISKEAYYYKSIYNRYFPYYPNPIEHYWMPKWSKGIDPTNPSGRILPVFRL
jgi:asparagine synthase (glutamine-hydrolysing)